MPGSKIVPVQCGVEVNEAAGYVREWTLAVILCGTSVRPLDDVAGAKASLLPRMGHSNVHEMLHCMVVIFYHWKQKSVTM